MNKRRRAKTDPRGRDVIIRADGRRVWCRRAYLNSAHGEWVFEMRRPHKARSWEICLKKQVTTPGMRPLVAINSEDGKPIEFEGFTFDNPFPGR